MNTKETIKQNYIRALLFTLYKNDLISYDEWQDTLNELEKGSIL